MQGNNLLMSNFEFSSQKYLHFELKIRSNSKKNMITVMNTKNINK